MVTTATAPRLSASVILTRDGGAGLEVFMVRRHERSHALPSVYVFPGGTVRADDLRGPQVPESVVATLLERSVERIEPAAAAGFFRCGLRELFEEAGVLLVEEASGDDTPGVDLAEERRLLQRGGRALEAFLADLGRAPSFESLIPFSHWITPEGYTARFDTWFFVATMPAAQEALHCEIETTEGTWVSPLEALAGSSEGRFAIVYPTEMHLRAVAPFDRVQDLVAFATSKPIPSVRPIWVGEGEGRQPLVPPELAGVW